MLQSTCHLLDRPQCFRLGRASPVGIFTRGFQTPSQGAHNNISERTLKLIGMGRLNWLFLGSDTGGQTAAVWFSFTATCKHLGMDAFAYLRDVLERLPTHPTDRLDELLPHRWLAARTASTATEIDPNAR